MTRSMSTLALLTTLVTGLLCTTAGSVEAQTTPKVFYACYVPTSGTTYRIKEPGTRTQCQSGHVEFRWTDGVNAVRSGDAAGGDLLGTYPNPTVAQVQGQPVSSTAPSANGQVLAWDGSAWAPTTQAAGDHGALTGLNDDDHNFYLLSDGVRESREGFAVKGFNLNLPTVASGVGIRLMWDSPRAAFRVGEVTSGCPDAWDTHNIGLWSVAMGHCASAPNTASIALGNHSSARGDRAFAIGEGAKAYGTFSAAMGSETIANGERSTAIGFNTWASGHNSTAIGCNADTEGMDGSIVFGTMCDVFSDRVSVTAPYSFVARAWHFWFGKTNRQIATAGRLIETSTGAYLSDGGDWTNASDVNRKENFLDQDAGAVLERLSRLSIRSWNYKAEDDSVRHLGPTAQDFYAAFRLGDSDKAIGTVDAAGVALLAIQALEKRTRDLDDLRARVDALVRANELLTAELAALRAEARRP